MRSRTAIALLILVVLVLVAFKTVVVVVDETRQVVITQLGKPVRDIIDPGLHFKLPPPVQSVTSFDKRVLEYDSSPQEVLTRDKKNLIVDNYARWRIVDPLKFLQTVRDENGAQARLDDIIYSELRIELGLYNLSQVVSQDRQTVMENVTRKSNQKASEYGIEIVDVRIKRADLPSENEAAVFARMRAERERQALQYRSEGREEAAKIRAQTEKEKTIILAEAYRASQILRGEGDAEATRIYAAAFNKDAEFYSFLRSLEAYEKTLAGKTTVFLSPESDFLRYFGSSR
ncbi:MAG: protease modulator HflC [Firmicutes bacterium]|nr:protease modulator HflC [Bacillota bacterium]